MSVRATSFVISTGAVGTTFSPFAGGLPFTPTWGMIVYCGRASVGQGEATHTWGVGIFKTTGLRRVFTCGSAHASANAEAQMMWRNDACVAVINPVDGTVVALLDVDAMLSNDVRFIVDDQFATALIAWVIVGDTPNVDIVDFVGPAAPGNQDVATAFALNTGLDDKAVICLGGVNAAANTGTVWGEFGIGAAAGETIAQAVAYFASQDSVATMATWGYGRTGQLGVFSTAADGIANSRFSLTLWQSTGFRTNWAATGGASIRYSALVLKGGPGERFAVGDFNTATDTNPRSESTPYVPLGLLFASACRAMSAADTTTPHAEISVGVAIDAGSRFAAGIADKDAGADSDVATAFRDDAFYINQDTGAAAIVEEGVADIDSLDGTPGFTWRMDNADPSAMFVWYLVFGRLGVGTRVGNRLVNGGLIGGRMVR